MLNNIIKQSYCRMNNYNNLHIDNRNRQLLIKKKVLAVSGYLFLADRLPSKRVLIKYNHILTVKIPLNFP